jgi:hypothetical protein
MRYQLASSGIHEAVRSVHILDLCTPPVPFELNGLVVEKVWCEMSASEERGRLAKWQPWALYRRSVCPRCDWFRDELINA